MNTKPRRKPEVDYNILEEEFTSPNPLTDAEYIYRLKEAISSLPTADKDILLLYLDEGSYRKAGRKIGVSSSLYYNQLHKVKARLLQKIQPEPID